MIDKNYHSRLLDLSKNFDKVIERMKGSYIDQRVQMHWSLWLLLAPFRDLTRIKSIQDGLKKFLSSSVILSFITPVFTVLGIILLKDTDLPMYAKNIGPGVVGYLISILCYFPLILSFKSEHFHIGAYKVWRNQEYTLFRGAFLDNMDDFYFKGLYDYVTHTGEVHHLVEKRLGDFLHNERAEFKSKIQSLEDRLDRVNDNTELITEKYNEFTSELIEERDELLRELEYLIKLLKDINMLLFRKFNGKFSKKDLNILTGFTLYELKGDKLILIEDVQTSASSPNTISLKDKKYARFGAVKVILDGEKSTPYMNTPYPGHVVISFRMNMDNKGVWVYNFHFDESDNRTWKLLVENGKIESREIYRLIHALCLLSLDDNHFSKKEAVSK